MFTRFSISNQKGFTLIEIIAVLLILSFLAAVAVPRYIDIETNSKQKNIDGAISELNGRENLNWANQKLSASGYDDDQKLIDAMDYNLGGDYTWTAGPTESGGTIEFKGLSEGLSRTQSTVSQPAVWSR